MMARQREKMTERLHGKEGHCSPFSAGGDHTVAPSI